MKAASTGISGPIPRSKTRAGLDPETRKSVEGLVLALFFGALCWGVLIGIGYAIWRAFA